MGKYFGTDGVRGVANSELTPEIAFKIGRASGYFLTPSSKRSTILIGRDTRISGEMIEASLISGLLSVGADVMRLGVITTPGVAHLTREMNAQCGIMISASHNPFSDNGIKLFGSDGFKISDILEQKIEAFIDTNEDNLPRPIGKDIGTVSDYFEGTHKYMAHLKQTISNDFQEIHIALDCAHGAASTIAPRLFIDLGADISLMGSSPTGFNINDGVGSTIPDNLANFVQDKEANIGLAFDGDADRIIAIDETGKVIGGDHIMYICAKYLKEQNNLNNNTIVSTIMSNIGLYKQLSEEGIKSVKTNVGDRFVVEKLRQEKLNFGGEQSGHLIFLDHSTTGDGLLTGLQLVSIMKHTNKKLSELVAELKIYPQKLVNINTANKDKILEHNEVKEAISKFSHEIQDNGRILVRASGTEPLIRVMVEADTEEKCNDYIEKMQLIINNIDLK